MTPRICATPGCGKVLNRCTKGALCLPCFNRTPAHRKTISEVMTDWASDPCRRCGKWPLSIRNQTGYCRECSRRHVTHRQKVA